MELGLSIEMADRDLGVIYRYFHESPGRQPGKGNQEKATRRRQPGEGNQAEAARRDYSRLKLMVLQ